MSCEDLSAVLVATLRRPPSAGRVFQVCCSCGHCTRCTAMAVLGACSENLCFLDLPICASACHQVVNAGPGQRPEEWSPLFAQIKEVATV